MLTADEQRKAAEKFAAEWRGRGEELQDTHPFWVQLLQTVYGVDNPTRYLKFEKPVKLSLGDKSAKRIDVYIPETSVLIEQKSCSIKLDKKGGQSDGTELSPYEQARRYNNALVPSQRARYIIVCNFQTFLIYDEEHPEAGPFSIELAELPKLAYQLNGFFVVGEKPRDLHKEAELSVEAGRLVGDLYDALKAQYKEPEAPETLRSLNVLCVRLVFCLYAEDSGLFARLDQFYDYMVSFLPENMRKALIDLFEVLDQPPEERDPYLEDKLAAFPYVNGGLFSRKEKILIPPFNDEIIEMLLERASLGFDWSEISPTIFGAVFESTLNPETRSKGGMYYTSVENIHKVIDPLFLDDLSDELDAIKTYKDDRTLDRKLRDFTAKLSKLTFLDPACGSGNFLTETYLSLRRLENEALKLLFRYAQQFAFADPIQISIAQFYGIEINDFAVTVARTALWIAEHQMLKETEAIISREIDFLPLKSYSNIVEGNALRLDWAEVVKPQALNYIMGNPPFLGYSDQSREQKGDMLQLYVDENGKSYSRVGKLDYVAGWYMKAARYMQGTTIKAALVSTNSITQGEQVAALWPPLMERLNLQIIFAWRTFIWDSEATDKAHVHCVIVGFTCGSFDGKRTIYDGESVENTAGIGPYLIPGLPVYARSRNKPLCNVPEMITGNRPADGGALIIEKADYDDFLAREPQAAHYIKRLMGSEEFINGKERYCLWLVGVSPAELRSMPLVMERVERCRKERLGGAPDRQKLAAIPTLFRETLNPDRFIIVPKVSSERRSYVPMGLGDSETIVTDLLFLIPLADLYLLGVLASSVHMAWMRTVCGRLEMRYRYSKDVVYNNFIWPDATDSEKEKITATAQAILDARALYPDSTLADLYDNLTMPPELRKAHEANDKAVLAAYGLKPGLAESEIVAHLFKLYERKVRELEKSPA